MVIHLSDTTVFAPMRYERARKTGISQQSGIRKLITCYLYFSAESQKFSRWEGVIKSDRVGWRRSSFRTRRRSFTVVEFSTSFFLLSLHFFTFFIFHFFSSSTFAFSLHSNFICREERREIHTISFSLHGDDLKISFENFHQPFVLFYALILQ